MLNFLKLKLCLFQRHHLGIRKASHSLRFLHIQDDLCNHQQTALPLWNSGSPMRSTSTSLEQRQLQDGHTDEVKNSFTLLPTTSPPRCHSSVPKETSLACDFSTGRMWEYLSEQPASLAVQQRHWQTNQLLSHHIQYAEMCCKTQGVVTVRKEEPEKQQLGLLAMAPHSSTVAWKIPWTGEPGGLQSMGLQS